MSRYNTSLKYHVQYNAVRAGAAWQFGGYSLGNGSDGAYQFDVGADFAGFSFDAIYSYANDVVALSNYTSGAPNLNDLKATLSDISGVVFAGKYTYQQLQVFGGYEFVDFMPPSDPHLSGFESLGGYTVLPSGLASTATYANNSTCRSPGSAQNMPSVPISI